jgi:hypothetical protein
LVLLGEIQDINTIESKALTEDVDSYIENQFRGQFSARIDFSPNGGLRL